MSHETFEVGEIAICITDVSGYNGALVGQECEVISPLGDYSGRYFGAPPGALGYLCQFPGMKFPQLCLQQELRKRRPPQDPAFLKFRDSLTRQARWLQSAIDAVRKEFERV